MIDPRALDTLVEIVAEAPDDGQVVVDVGSNGFKTLRPANEQDDLIGDLIAEIPRAHGVAISRDDPVVAVVLLNQIVLRRYLDGDGRAAPPMPSGRRPMGKGQIAVKLYTNTVKRRAPAGYRHGRRVIGMRICPELPSPSRANRPLPSRPAAPGPPAWDEAPEPMPDWDLLK
jgi:hypothetical protein